MVFSVQGAAALDEEDEEDEDTELRDELLRSKTELELLEREELLADVTVELADDVVTEPQRLPVSTGTSAAAAPFVP